MIGALRLKTTEVVTTSAAPLNFQTRSESLNAHAEDFRGVLVDHLVPSSRRFQSGGVAQEQDLRISLLQAARRMNSQAKPGPVGLHRPGEKPPQGGLAGHSTRFQPPCGGLRMCLPPFASLDASLRGCSGCEPRKSCQELWVKSCAFVAPGRPMWYNGKSSIGLHNLWVKSLWTS